MPPKFTARQLQYDAPPIPSFLKQLHSQVNARNGNIDDKRSHRNEDEFDALLGGTSEKIGKSSNNGKEDEQQEDEWDGAQVVVLKEGKHLSRKDLEAGQKGQVQGAEDNNDSANIKLEAGVCTSKAGKGPIGKMQDVKDLIAQSKSTTLEEDSEADRNQKRKLEKERVREEKNKKARAEKSRRGKGLSFNMDD